MKFLAMLLFPMLALAVVGYSLVMPAVAAIGHLTAVVAGVK